MNANFFLNGDTAISVEFGNDISIETNQKVIAFQQMLSDEPIEGISETIPTYRSLMIHYRPETISYYELLEACRKRLDKMDTQQGISVADAKVLEIPVLYGGDYGMDLEEVARFHNKKPQEIINIHSSHLSIVYMFGFLPGQAYMGSDNGFTIPRRTSPRLKVEGGSIIIWENQTIMLPNTSPTGWHVIGHSPIKIFNITNPDPFLLKAGYWVKFVPITQDEHDRIRAEVEAGTYQCKIYSKEEQ